MLLVTYYALKYAGIVGQGLMPFVIIDYQSEKLLLYEEYIYRLENSYHMIESRLKLFLSNEMN